MRRGAAFTLSGLFAAGLIGIISMSGLLPGTAASAGTSASTSTSARSISSQETAGWTPIDLGDDAVCSDGSDYHIYVRYADSDNLMVHFTGGGACWDGETCSRPITLAHIDGFYFATIWDLMRSTLSGIFRQNDADNPIRDWNVVDLPYCTADLHVGDATRTYIAPGGSPVTIHHNGRRNVTEALDWVYAHFDHPETLLIDGESAGGFGSILWTPTLAAHYPDSQIYQLADGAYLQAPIWKDIIETWNASWLGFDVSDDLVADAYLSYAQNPPDNVTYLHVNTVYDATLMVFAAHMNGVPDDDALRATFTEGMRASMQRIGESGLPYYFYLTDYGLDARSGTTPHTLVSTPQFDTAVQDGIFLHDWLRRILDGERFSVGGSLMP